MDESTTKYRRQIGRFRVVIGILSILCLALLIALIVVGVKSKEAIDNAQPATCPSGQSSIDLNPPAVLPPFHDLTSGEIMKVKEFLYDQDDLNLVKATNIRCNLSYIFNIELRIPNKEMAVQYLDQGKAPPTREAHVVIFRGDKPEPYVEEYTVGPLPNPIYKKNHQTFPFRYRPATTPEMVGAATLLMTEVQSKVSTILLESYGGKLVDCEPKCLDFAMITPMSSVSSGEPVSRKMWFWLTPVVEFWSLYPLDFLVLLDLTSKDTNAYRIDKIYHAGEMFRTLDDLKQAYDDGSLRKTNIPFPDVKADPFATMTRHGKLFPDNPLPPPIEFEPSGKRYSIKGRHISYMGWDFDLRMSTISGPQLFDVQYQEERIVYELSLQEIAVYYSADNPANRFADYIDSIALIGSRARSLVPGSDCPKHATFIPVTHALEYLEEPVVFDRAFCVFEHDTAKPLRRHLTSSGNTRFYGGMTDVTLTVRTIATVVNYDYIFDFIFHQNGAIEVSVLSTGYILTAFRFPDEDPYGFRLGDHMTGSLHHHMFNFKVDMDINGRENRFETLSISPKEVDNSKWSAKIGATYWQTNFTRNHIKSERKAAMKYDFADPKYLIFHNNLKKTKYGVPKAYRLLNRGMSKQLYKEGEGQEPSVSWSRYQVAVTKYSESEPRSSSMYAVWDGADPVVNFQRFIDNDENIVDEDQVAWVSMGVHHIPHTEDFPISPTVGLSVDFFLLPYNYFDHDPAMGSSDLVRIVPDQQYGLRRGVEINRNGDTSNSQCVPKKSTYDKDIQNYPTALFDSEDAAPPI